MNKSIICAAQNNRYECEIINSPKSYSPFVSNDSTLMSVSSSGYLPYFRVTWKTVYYPVPAKKKSIKLSRNYKNQGQISNTTQKQRNTSEPTWRTFQTGKSIFPSLKSYKISSIKSDFLQMQQQHRHRHLQQISSNETPRPQSLIAISTTVDKSGRSTFLRRLHTQELYTPLTSERDSLRTQDILMALTSKNLSNTLQQSKTMDLFWIPKRPKVWRFSWMPIYM